MTALEKWFYKQVFLLLAIILNLVVSLGLLVVGIWDFCIWAIHPDRIQTFREAVMWMLFFIALNGQSWLRTKKDEQKKDDHEQEPTGR
jgi:uncharacterized membrane protein YqjE